MVDNEKKNNFSMREILSNIFENEYIKMELKNNICYIEYKPNTVVDIDIARELYQKRIEMSKHNEQYAMVSDIRNLKSVSKEARDFLEDKNEYISVAAFVVGNSISKIILNFFLTINKPKVESKIFTSISEAEEWVNSI